MDQVQLVRHLILVEGRSRRRVARELGIGRNTLNKYLREPEPKRKETEARARPVWERIKKRVRALLEEWSARTTTKQRLTAARLHRQLVEEGFQVGETLVKEQVRLWRRGRQEVFIPLVHHRGDEAQVDFFQVTVSIRGILRKAWMFVMRLMYSGRDFAWLYDRCDQVALLDGHVRAFGHFGVVPRRGIYDNLKPAVRKLLRNERQLTERFAALASHYLFEPCFARPGEGHDKGGVESRGKAVRLQHLTPIPTGEDLRSISSQLLADLDERAGKTDAQGLSVLTRFEEERVAMRPLPAMPFDPRQVLVVPLHRTPKVSVAGGFYSIPSHWVKLGFQVTAYVGADEVTFTFRNESVTRARQLFGGSDIRYRDMLPELAKKPQAVRQVAPVLLAELGEPFGKFWSLLAETHGEREAGRVLAKVLAAMSEHGEESVRDALVSALRAKRADLLDLARLVARPTPATIEVPAALAGIEVERACAADYDLLLVAGDAS